MADAKKCDRCGKLYELYGGIEFDGFKYIWLELFTANGSRYKKFDLCPDCMGRIIAFLQDDTRSCENCADKHHNVCECDILMDNCKPRNCKTCKYNEMGLDVCMGCSSGNYEMWEPKNE